MGLVTRVNKTVLFKAFKFGIHKLEQFFQIKLATVIV